jgi:hypothetical protein
MGPVHDGDLIRLKLIYIQACMSRKEKKVRVCACIYEAKDRGKV